ncbi:MAG: GLUG motif-containing protein, partial [Planctomycetota bacterium]
LGFNSQGVVNNSFWDVETSGLTTSAGGRGKTTAEMQTASTFSTWTCCNCTPVWTIDEQNDYPRLWWENAPGEPITVGLCLGGSGTQADPYFIYTAEQLNAIGLFPCLLDKHFKLMADIDLASFLGTAFNIIGTAANPFTGVFDGNGHTISNFTYTSTRRNNIGLFGYVDDPNAEIKNLGLTDAEVDAGTGRYVGSLVGPLRYGTISNCYSTGSVAGYRYVGGLVGYNRGIINNCYAENSVKGDWNLGGLVGFNEFGTINNCYSSGSVAGDWLVGGLVGCNYQGTVTNSFWDIETSGQASSDGGTGQTMAQMQVASTYLGWNGCGEIIWTIDEGNDYPRLLWEARSGQPLPEHQLGDFLQGSGSEIDPYLVYTAEQLNMIGLFLCEWDKYFKLMADINLAGFTGTSFNIIGTGYTYPFTGVFDGSGHTISNFSYTSIGTSYTGLFGYINDPDAEIKNLGLIDPNIDAGTGNYVGSLVGALWDGTITNCYVEGGSVLANGSVGGLVGENYGTITNSYSTGSVSGLYCVGGLLGINGDDGRISNCYSTGSVAGDNYVGGLVGLNREGTISNSYSTGSILGGHRVGGLVGWNLEGTITDSYATGSVSGDYRVGGLVGYNWGGEVTDSFWDIDTSGQTTSDGGTGLPTAEMQTQSTFTDAGWDFVGETFNGIKDIWFIPQGDYPHLWWEGMQVPMKLTPRTLNCRSKGNWVKAHLTLPQRFTVADVDPDRPAVLHSFGFQSAPLYVSVNELVQIEAAFEREALCSLAGDWPQMLTVAGFLTDGNIFLGTSTVRMITPGLKDIEELALYWLNADCIQPDFCDGIDMNRDSLVNFPDYALFLNSQVEFVSE